MKISNSYKITLLPFLFAVAIDGSASDITSREFSKCASIKGDLARLDCFDQLAIRKNLSGPQVESLKIDNQGKWKIQESINPVDDSKMVLLSLDADSRKSRYGKAISLIARCRRNKTELYIRWHEFLGSEAYVLSRIGSKKAKTKKWTLSTDKMSTFYPESAIGFLMKMMKSDNFLAQVTPYNESPVTAIFDTKGMESAIQPLRKTCGWTKEQFAQARKKREAEKKERNKKGIIYKKFIESHRGSRVLIKSSEWKKLDKWSQNLLDGEMTIILVGDDESNVVDLPKK